MSGYFTFLYYLSGIPTLIEKILEYLDFVSLKNIQCVCRLWNEAVNNGRAWGNQLQYHVRLPLESHMHFHFSHAFVLSVGNQDHLEADS